MKKIINIIFLFLFLSSCHHIDDVKYENIYFKDLKKEIGGQVEQKNEIDSIRISQKETFAPLAQNITLPVEKDNTSKTITARPEIQPTQAVKKKRKTRIGQLTIESDSMTYNKETSMAIFLGNVKLKSHGVMLFCDELKSVNYRDSADAGGNVRVEYKDQKVKIRCNRVKYNKAMSTIEAYENVIAEKILDNNEKINLFADKIKYDVESGEIFATKVNKKVKIKFKDIVAFSDKVIYNEFTEEIELTGNPFVRKQESTFISSKIIIDINKKIIKMKESIWAKLFYEDFEDIKKEAEVEKNNNNTSH